MEIFFIADKGSNPNHGERNGQYIQPAGAEQQGFGPKKTVSLLAGFKQVLQHHQQQKQECSKNCKNDHPGGWNWDHGQVFPPNYQIPQCPNALTITSSK
jgi:hypothetical protein